MSKRFSASPIYISPILASLLVGIFCMFLFIESRVDVGSVTVLPETGVGPWVNAAIFVSASGSAATLIYFLLKRHVYNVIRFIMAVAFSILTFSLSALYISIALQIMRFNVYPWIVLVFSISVTSLVVVQVVLKRIAGGEVVVLILGGASGALLGRVIPMSSSLLILVLLALYDVIAVFRGPVGKIAKKGLEHLPGASFAFRDIHVGLGDLVFYSMLVDRVFLSYGWGACLASMIGVLFGALLSFKLVEREGMFPGLPLPIIFGLLGAVILLYI